MGGAVIPTPLDLRPFHVLELNMSPFTERDRPSAAILLTASVLNTRFPEIAAIIHTAGQQGEFIPYDMAELLAAKDLFAASVRYGAVFVDLTRREQVNNNLDSRRWKSCGGSLEVMEVRPSE